MEDLLGVLLHKYKELNKLPKKRASKRKPHNQCPKESSKKNCRRTLI